MSQTNPDLPGMSPPPGINPCFDDPFTLRPYNTLTVVACAVTTTFMLVARLYTKQYLLRSITSEDCELMPPTQHWGRTFKIDFEKGACVVGWVCTSLW